jgi:hypothetical protein
MMMVVGHLLEFVDIDQLGKFVKMEHRLVFAVLAKKRDVLTEIHILQVICDETAVAPLNALSEVFDAKCRFTHKTLSDFITGKEPKKSASSKYDAAF